MIQNLKLTKLVWAFLVMTAQLFAQAPFNDSPVFEPIDYNNLNYWAAHPDKKDNADRIPGTEILAKSNLEADVFFVHPTIYSDKSDKFTLESQY